MAIAILLDFKYHVFPPDAISRMANGFYVLYSRHPHLAAIGFVWNPLQSIADMIPLAFKDLWPAMSVNDLAGSLVSVACMVGAVHQLRCVLDEAGVSRAPRLVLTGLFAFNPMVLYYAGNGMSEAMYLFTALAVCRYLQRWFRDGDLHSLVYAAIALGLGYLARNEAAFIALFGGMLVIAKAYTASSGRFRARAMSGLTDGTIFLLPVITSFVGWAMASYIITGQPFQQFTSQYGNTAELAAYGSSYGVQPGHIALRVRHELTDLTHLAPLLALVLVLALLKAWRTKDWQILVPLAVLGGGLSFTLFTYLDSQEFPWYRFYILSVPLDVICAGMLFIPLRHLLARGQPLAGVAGSGSDGHYGRRSLPRGVLSFVYVLIALALIAPSLVTTATGMFNPKVGLEEGFQIGFIAHEKGAETAAQRATTIPMLSYIERLNVPTGSVVTDEDLAGCATTMIVRSTNPTIFVIPNDSDFQRILDDPLTFHAHYILAPIPAGDDAGILLSKTYPNLYNTGAGFTRLVKSFPQTALCPPYRLYRVTGHPNQTP
jgi:hypothetical protein